MLEGLIRKPMPSIFPLPLILSHCVECRKNGTRDVFQGLDPVADLPLMRTERDERHRVARVAAVVHAFDVAVVRRHDDRDARCLREPDERREEPVVSAQHRARARIIHRVTRHVRLEELVQREVVLPRERKEMLRRTLRRDDADVGIAVLNRLARQVLHQRPVFHEVVRRRDHLGRRQRHHCRHRLVAPRNQLFRRLDQIRVGKAHLLVALAQLEKKVVLLDDLPKRRPGEPFAMPAHRLRTIHPREHRRLPRRRLRKALDAQTRVHRLRMFLEKTAQRRTHLRVHRIVRRRVAHADAIDKEEDDFQGCPIISKSNSFVLFAHADILGFFCNFHFPSSDIPHC